MRILLWIQLLLTSAGAAWVFVPWKPGQQHANGHAVLDTDNSPSHFGWSQAAYYHFADFGATVRWRPGDVVTIGRDALELCYVLESDAAEPVSVEVALTHPLSQGEHFITSTCEWTPVLSELVMEVYAERPTFEVHLKVFLDDLPRRVALTAAQDAFEVDMTAGEAGALRVEGDTVIVSPLRATSEDDLLTVRLREAEQFPISWNRFTATLVPHQGELIPEESDLEFRIGGAVGKRTAPAIEVAPLPTTSMLVEGEEPLPFAIPIRGIQTRSGRPPTARLVGSGGSTEVEQPKLIFEEGRLKNLSFEWQPQASKDYALAFWCLESDGVEATRRSETYFHRGYQARPLHPHLTPPTGDIKFYRKEQSRPPWEDNLALTYKRKEPGSQPGTHLSWMHTVGSDSEGAGDRAVPAAWRMDGQLTRLSESQGAALAINDHGDVVGHIETSALTKAFFAAREDRTYTTKVLESPPFALNTRALAINEHRRAVGFTQTATQAHPKPIACWWDLDKGVAIRALPLPDGALESIAFDLDIDGTIVGYFIDANGDKQACQWQPTDDGYRVKALGFQGEATGINNVGTIVGTHAATGPFMIQAKRFYDLNSYVKESGSFTMLTAIDINLHGEISGRGIIDGEEMPILLQPIHE